MADEYGSESYRGAVDITIFDPAGKEIKAIKGSQDSEIEVDSHGIKVSTLPHPQPVAENFRLAVVACAVGAWCECGASTVGACACLSHCHTVWLLRTGVISVVVICRYLSLGVWHAVEWPFHGVCHNKCRS